MFGSQDRDVGIRGIFMENPGEKRFMMAIDTLATFFRNYFHEEAEEVFSSPGRIELLGNHTDHNCGKALVGSVDLSILAVVGKSDQPYFVYKTDGYNEMKIALDDLKFRPEEQGQSIGLIRGVLFYLKERGYALGGIRVVTTTNIFKGAGVSSSAAFENLIGRIISYCYNDDAVSAFEIAKISQLAETHYFGKACGLLDQMGSSYGGVNYIDFANNEKPFVRNLRFFFRKYDIILTYCLDSHTALTRHYLKIQKDMKDLSSFFGKNYLREVDESEYYARRKELIERFSESVYLRGEHFFEENRRVELALKAIENRDEDSLVRLIDQSGDSSYRKLKNCYVKNVKENLPQGILLSKKINENGGTRVHGGGFAGTVLSLVRKEESGVFLSEMQRRFGKNNAKKVRLSKFGTRHIGHLGERKEKECKE